MLETLNQWINFLFEVHTNTANVEQLTKNGAKFHVKLDDAMKIPIFQIFQFFFISNIIQLF